MRCSVTFGSISSKKACFLFSSSAIKVHDSQAYENIDMTRERISFTFDPRDNLCSSGGTMVLGKLSVPGLPTNLN